MSFQDKDLHPDEKLAPNDRRNFFRKTIAIGVVAAAAPHLSKAQSVQIEAFEEGDAACRILIDKVTPTYQVVPMLAEFIRLSVALTGVEPLSVPLAHQYLNHFATHPQLTDLLPKLIAAWHELTLNNHLPTESEIDQRIFQDQQLRPAAEQLIYLWYVSAFFLPPDAKSQKSSWIYVSAELYAQGLLWSVAHAHAPMTSGGPYGYWADAPST